MKFEEVEEGMVFDQFTSPQFLYIEKVSPDGFKIIGIDSYVHPGDPEWDNGGMLVDAYEWEDYFSEVELVVSEEKKRQVFKELFK